MQERLAVNEIGEFTEQCICQNMDFYPVVKAGDGWREVESDSPCDVWACIACSRVINADGYVIDNSNNVEYAE